MEIQMNTPGETAGHDAQLQGAASACCSPAEQEACCAPAEKAACCGPVPAAGGGCGCQ
jgi:hypothetical protein